jgi:hypothetical protein
MKRIFARGLIYGAEETLVFTPKLCQLMQGENRRPIKVGTRRGLFAQDTDMVLNICQILRIHT